MNQLQGYLGFDDIPSVGKSGVMTRSKDDLEIDNKEQFEEDFFLRPSPSNRARRSTLARATTSVGSNPLGKHKLSVSRSFSSMDTKCQLNQSEKDKKKA